MADTEMLQKLTTERRALQSKIKRFTAQPPQALRIQVDGRPVVFPIDAATGKLSALPPVGVWGWAKDLFWIDLKQFLQRKQYNVEEVMGSVMAAS